MTAQKELVMRIKAEYNETVNRYMRVRHNWQGLRVSEISDLTTNLQEAIAMARTGLEHPTDADEFDKIAKMIETMEDYYFQAAKAGREQQRLERKLALKHEKARQKSRRSGGGHLDVIEEDEDGDQ
ncbi:hypothetical protein F4802DRAFT_603331 [Xylaria palmicola]|nr:hypothetical protein F4802DRAFT_603331 [Xylaria palmicola]